MKMIKMALVGLILSISSYSNAALIINIYENAGTVEASYSGSINISALQEYAGGTSAMSAFQASLGAIGFTTGAADVYEVNIAS
jgi:hypothetical protein